MQLIHKDSAIDYVLKLFIELMRSTEDAQHISDFFGNLQILLLQLNKTKLFRGELLHASQLNVCTR